MVTGRVAIRENTEIDFYQQQMEGVSEWKQMKRVKESKTFWMGIKFKKKTKKNPLRFMLSSIGACSPFMCVTNWCAFQLSHPGSKENNKKAEA